MKKTRSKKSRDTVPLTNYPLEWQEQRHVLFTVCTGTKRWILQQAASQNGSALTSFLFIRKPIYSEHDKNIAFIIIYAVLFYGRAVVKHHHFLKHFVMQPLQNKPLRSSTVLYLSSIELVWVVLWIKDCSLGFRNSHKEQNVENIERFSRTHTSSYFVSVCMAKKRNEPWV